MQNTNHLLLVRPAHFTFNTETEASNTFQNNVNDAEGSIQQKVLTEFENVITQLQANGMQLTIIQDTLSPIKPDAVFPNNWVSFHEDGTIVLYPMFAPNRRNERRQDIIDVIKKKFVVKNVIDLSAYEEKSKFLEGTGSIIFDHLDKTAYACLSPRTDKDLFIQTCDQLHYKPIYFISKDINGKQIYHTNVMMCIAEKFAVICLESIPNKQEKEIVSNSLFRSGHELIEISFDQMNKFAGNMLEVKNQQGKQLLILSKRAHDSLTFSQKNQIEKYTTLLPVSIHTLETIGGGSARCMIAEVFLKPRFSSEKTQ